MNSTAQSAAPSSMPVECRAAFVRFAAMRNKKRAKGPDKLVGMRNMSAPQGFEQIVRNQPPVALRRVSPLHEVAGERRRRDHRADVLAFANACELPMRHVQRADWAVCCCRLTRTFGIEHTLITQPILELRITDVQSLKKLDASCNVRRVQVSAHLDAGRVKGDPARSCP